MKPGWCPVLARQAPGEKSESVRHSVMSDACNPTRRLCPLDSSGKNNGVGCHSLRQGIFLIQESDPGMKPPSPAFQVDSLLTEPPGMPRVSEGEGYGARGWFLGG